MFSSFSEISFIFHIIGSTYLCYFIIDWIFTRQGRAYERFTKNIRNIFSYFARHNNDVNIRPEKLLTPMILIMMMIF